MGTRHGGKDMYALEGWRTDEDEEYTSYDDAIDRYDSLLDEARIEGWYVEHGWASRDNLLAAADSRQWCRSVSGDCPHRTR